MKNSEFNVFDEYQRTNENINFQAIQYSVTSKESYIQKDEVLRTNEENLLNNSNKKISSKTDTSIVKKLIQKVTEATSSLIGNIAITATIAVTSIVIFSSVLIKAPNIELLDLIAGYDYVSYNIYIDETSEDMDYYVIISNNFENYIYELHEGENLGNVNNLKHNLEYELAVIGIGKSDKQEIKYFKTKFYTTTSVKIISIKWIVEGIIVKEEETEENFNPSYDGATPIKPSTNQFNYTFLKWNVSVDDYGNITYIAEFIESVRLYTVKWIVEDNIVKEDQIEYGVTPTYNGDTPTKASTNEFNYTFLKWNETTDEMGNITYIAEFTESSRLYSVIWISENVILEEDQIEYGVTPTYNGATPTKPSTNEFNYTFLKWNKTTDEIGNITYVAEFTQSTRLYSVTWISENVILEEDQIEYGVTPTYNGATPTKESTNEFDYTFLKWNETTDEMGNITYIAEFTQSTRLYSVTWISENVVLEEDQIEYGVTPTYNGDTPTKASTNEFNYTFLKWNKTTDEIGNITYIAEFTQSTRLYSVTWISENVILEEDQIEYGAIPTYDGVTPSKEMTVDEEYTFIGWDKEISSVTSDISYNAVFETIIHEYTATFIELNPEELTIDYDNPDVYSITFNTNFDNSSDSRLLYRIILTDVETNTQYTYEGTDAIATIDVLSSVKELSISYEYVGLYNEMEKVFEVSNVVDHIVISNITVEIQDEYTLIDTDLYEFNLLVNSNYSNEEVYNYLELVITYDDLSKKEVLIENIFVNEYMSINIDVPQYCNSFTIEYKINLLDRYGLNERIISGTKEITLETIYELKQVYVDTRMFNTAKFKFIHHFVDENTTIAVKDTISGETVLLTEEYDYVEFSINSTQQDFTYYLSSLNNEILDNEKQISFDSSNVNGEYKFNYTNPGDAIVTFNDDGTMNIYLDTTFETEDSDIYYLIRYTDFNSENVFEIKYNESVSVIENIPFSNYGIEYYVYKTVNGIEYCLDYIAVSGGVEIIYDSIISAYIERDNNNNLVLYGSFGDYYNVNFDSIVLFIDDQEISINSSDITLVDGTYQFNYIFDIEPSQLKVQYQATYNKTAIYETIVSSGKLKGEQYRTMYCVVIE